MLKVHKPRNPFSPLNFLVGLYKYFLTIYGRALIFILFFSMMFISPGFTYYHIVVSFLGVLFAISFISMYLLPYNIKVTRYLPDRVQTGKEFTVTVDVKNNSFMSVFALTVEQIWRPPNFSQLTDSNLILNIKPGKNDKLRFKCKTAKRGAYELPSSIVFTNFPFFLMRKGKYLREKNVILSYPDYRPLENFILPVHRRYQPGGISLASNIGDSSEYIDNRDYKPGDPLKKIDWKAFARLQKLIIKEYQEEYFVRIALILDTYVPAKRKKECRGRFENSVSVCASIADYLSKMDYLIDIFVMGNKIYSLTAGRNIAFLNNILDLLACVDCDTSEYIENLYKDLAPNLKQTSSVILVLQDFDKNRHDLIKVLQSLGISLKIILMKKDTALPFSFKENENLTVRFVTDEKFKEGLSIL